MVINFKTLSTVSVIAMMAPLSVFAADIPATSVSGNSIVSPEEIRKETRVGQSILKTIKVFFAGLNENQSLEPILIHQNMTAHGFLGESVMNQNNEKIAVVNDIILDKMGNVILVVLTDKGFLGIGNKLAAFDYKDVISQDKDGNVTMALTQGMIDRATDFSYDRKDWAKAKIIPVDSMSTNMLLRGSLYDNMGHALATIENIYFRSAEVSQVIVGFNKTLGMGGNLAMLDFKDLQIVKKDSQIDFKLSDKQTVLFKRFEKSVSN